MSLLALIIAFALAGSLRGKKRSLWWLGFPYLTAVGAGLPVLLLSSEAGILAILLGWIAGIVFVATLKAAPEQIAPQIPQVIADSPIELQREMERLTTPAGRAEGIELEPLPPALQ